MASYFFQGTEIIDGVQKKRVFEVAGVSSVDAARKEIDKFHPNAKDVQQVTAESKGEQSVEQPRIIGPVAGEPGASGRLGSVAPNTVEQPPNSGPSAITPTQPK